MNRTLHTASLLAAFTFCPLYALAAPTPDRLPADVPAQHWAAGSVKRVVHQHIMGREADGRFRGDKAVTRYELAVTLDRFVRYIEAARKPLHVQTFPAPHSTAIKAPAAARRALVHLVSNGFLPVYSALVTQDGNKPATARELTDAVAAIMIRLSDRAEAPAKD